MRRTPAASKSTGFKRTGFPITDLAIGMLVGNIDEIAIAAIIGFIVQRGRHGFEGVAALESVVRIQEADDVAARKANPLVHGLIDTSVPSRKYAAVLRRRRSNDGERGIA